MSVFGKQFDKIMSRRYLTYGIRTKLIQDVHFCFISGTGCEDSLLFIFNLIEAQQIDKKAAQLVLLDFKSAFDTVRYDQFLETLRDGFGIHGHAYLFQAVAAALILIISNRSGATKSLDCFKAGHLPL